MYPMVKRVIDCIGAVFLLVLLLPMVLVVSLLVLLDGTGGGVFATHPLRVGISGKPFKMYKFRTMIPNAHRIDIEKVSLPPAIRDICKQNKKIPWRHDPRVTTVGRLLRLCDIDEIPQLVNVIFGHMSLVGPRPYLKKEIQDITRKNNEQVRSFETILSVRPGMTGLWQVSGRNDIPFIERIELDVNYVNNMSFFRDVKIILKTPTVLITRNGAW